MDPSEPGVAVFRRRYVAAPAAEVWEWLVDPERVAVYHPCLLAARPGAPGEPVEFRNRLSGLPVVTGEVVELLEGRRWVYTHRSAVPDAEPESRVEVELLRMGDELTCLEVRHTGLQPGGEDASTAERSWDVVLCGLKSAAETGRPLPWPRRGGTRD